MDPTPSRRAALARLTDFIPRAADYARVRNFDHGPDDRSNVSLLSPYLSHGLLSEEEVVRAVLKRHSPAAGGKFLQEVAWRTYWKGWLEMRPQLWDHYRETLAAERLGLGDDPDLQRAISGTTGIDCFDSWNSDLIDRHYLHNHARMWFASIWIFTLKLPWQLGADHFMTHLHDGDAASNTLSWRWVAGLHTRGKHYLARASNIEKFTGGRFNPVGQLDESAEPLPPDRDFDRLPLEPPDLRPPPGRVGRLLTTDDLAPPPADLGPIHAVAGGLPDGFNRAPAVDAFRRGALDDALDRFSGTRLDGNFQSALMAWIAAERLDSVVVARPRVGPWRDLLSEMNVPVHHFVRDWDRKLWPHATAGFFKLKKSLPGVYRLISEYER